MLRKMMIALAATAFVGAMVAADTADARMGGGGGGGFRGGGGFAGGGFRGGGFGGGGFRGGFAGGGFRGATFGGVRTAGVAPGFARGAVARGAFVNNGRFVGRGFRHGFNHRFRDRRFFAAAPFFVGAGFYPYYDDYAYGYGDPCWQQAWTAYGWQTVYVCGY